LIETMNAGIVSDPERNYYASLLELGSLAIEQQNDIGFDVETGLLGAALGGGFQNTAELIPMKYHEAMASPDKEGWIKAISEEHDRMVSHKVFKEVPRSEVPKDATIITSTWACKKKSSGTLRARMNG
jgi:hypothetical protein